MYVIDRPQTDRGNIAEFFRYDSALKNYWPLNSKYGLTDLISANHLIAADVLNGHGDFSIDADPFFTYAASWAVAGGTANHVAGVSDNFQTTTVFNPLIGKRYIITFTVTAIAGAVASFFFTFGGITGIGRMAVGTYSETITTVSTARFLFWATINCTGSIDNLTVREDYDGNIGPDGALFNGVSNCLQTTNPIDLTGTNKVTLLFSWKPAPYSLTSNTCMLEFSPTVITNAGSFNFNQRGDVANDPIRLLISDGVNGTLVNGGDYSNNTYGWENENVKDFAVVMNKSKVTNKELELYSNGMIVTKSTEYTYNTTGNFGNHNLYIGGRAGIIMFSNIAIKNLALFSRVLSQREIYEYYMWSNNLTNSTHLTMMDY